jgi:hypothetical protein
VRTTVNIDDELLRRAREEAVRTRRSLGDVVDDALRIMLSLSAPEVSSPVDLPTYGGSGVQPGVDLEDKDGLAALLDDDLAPNAAR